MSDHALGYVARALAQDRPVPEPRVHTPADLRAWREAEGLTQERAAKLAGVELRGWQRWESGERSVPQWLADVLLVRWGSAP